MKILLYEPTVVNISKKAMHRACLKYGDGLAPLMFSSIKTLETKPTKKHLSFMEKLANKFTTKTKLTIDVDVDYADEFVISAKRKLGQSEFEGKPIQFPLTSALSTTKFVKDALLKSKETVLNQITELNQSLSVRKIKTL